MLKVNIVTAGKIKESYYREAVQEYLKRLSRYAAVEIIEVKDEKTPDNPSAAEEEAVKKKEGERILSKIQDTDYVITLEIDGRALSSTELASFLEKQAAAGAGRFVFVIGASLGLSEQVSRRADFRLSFSRMTYPHQLMRVILLEQIYRAMRINANEPYHK